MSEDYQDGGGEVETRLWHGINLATVRSAYFHNLAGSIYSLSKLVTNGIETVFDTAQNGAVVMDGTYLNWQFIAPTGRFSASEFANVTVGGFFDIVISRAQSNPIRAWEEFAAMIGGRANMVNNLFEQVVSAVVTAPGTSEQIPFDSVPTFSTINTFSALATWIKGILPQAMLNKPASIMQAEAEGGRYSFCVILTMTTQNENSTREDSMTFTFIL